MPARGWSEVGLFRLRRPDEALTCYERALEINPRDLMAWYNKGVALGELGRPAEALTCFERALEIDPRLAQAWSSKGKALANLGRPDEALTCCDRALEINSSYAAAWNNKGNALLNLGRWRASSRPSGSAIRKLHRASACAVESSACELSACAGRVNMNKHFIFRHYWWIAILVATAIVLIMVFLPSGREGLIATPLGAALGFCYFAQKQKLEELRLFKDLFTNFSHRYDELNDRLEEIRAGNVDERAGRKTLVDYFNLCAEEFLFFDEGYIHPAAWRSWCRGMLQYLDDGGIRHVWNDEVRTDSYYGLTLEKIRDGAGVDECEMSPGNAR